MNRLKVLILEDEKHNRDRLIFLLEENFRDSLEVVGAAASIQEALALLKIRQADILLLDIELADGQVFELLNAIDYKKYKLIFITGYSEHAIKAIKYAAIDYLLKPIDTDELIQAIQKVQGSAQESNPILDDMLDRNKFDIAEYLIINSAQSIKKIPIDVISHLKADGIYTHIFHDNTTSISSKPIGIYEDILPVSQFNRCHKSYIVNRSFIKRVGRGRGPDLLLQNGEELPVAVRKKEEFMLWFNG
jgi:two-component system LytT family response regulator